MRVAAIEHLGCHEVWRARVRLHVVSSILCKPEVDKTNFVVGAKHDVLRLYVTMSDSKRVAVMQCLEALVNDICGLALCVGFSLLEEGFVAVKQLTTRAKLHNQVDVMLVLVGLKVLDNVWMINFLEQVDFVHHMCQV